VQVTKAANDARWASFLVVALVVLIGATQAARGVGFALDDFLSLSNARFGGVWSAAGHDRGIQRPMDFIVFGLTFGMLGEHPMAHLVMLTVLRAIAALLLLALLRQLLTAQAAVLITAIWVLQPNHVSTELWSTASILDVALVGLLAGVLLATRRPSRCRDVGIFVALLLGALTYEAIVFVGAFALLVVPWLLRKSIDWRAVIVGCTGLGLAAAWSLTHLEPSKHDAAKGFADLSPAIAAHFGYGVAPRGLGALVTIVAALIGLVVLSRAALRDAHARGLAMIAGAGVVVIALGVLPYMRDNYEPEGGGDRANIVSSIGGAMVWGSLLLAAWAARRAIAVTGAVVLIGLGLVRRWEVGGAWRDVFTDARNIEAALAMADPPPGGVVIVEPPPPVCENIAVYLGSDMLTGLTRIAVGSGDVRGLRADDPAAGTVAAAAHIDLRGLPLRCHNP